MEIKTWFYVEKNKEQTTSTTARIKVSMTVVKRLIPRRSEVYTTRPSSKPCCFVRTLRP